jgi:AAA15 family ATPase/GTPase
MLTSLHIQNFKGFKNTLIPELRKVNLILGGQNVGKTSLLEAVVFVAGDFESNTTPGARNRLPQMFRPCEGKDAIRFWGGIVGNEKSPISVWVKATINSKLYEMGGYKQDKGATEKLRLFFDDIGPVDWFARPIDMFAINLPRGTEIPYPFSTLPKKAADQVELYGRLVTGRKKNTVLKLLKKIEPRIDSIDAVAPDGEHRVYIDLTDGHVLPLSQLGHGFTRLFELYAGLAVTESKLALIDEIENGIHYSALPTLFQGVRELAESNDVQSLITTHSLECIKSAYEVFQDKLEDFQLIRLERTEDGNVRAVAINDENLKTIMESGWEIR